MKRILFIMSSLGGGGAERVLVTMLKNFDFAKYSVELCLINREGVLLKEIPENIKISYIYDKSSSLRSKIDYNLYSKFGLKTFEARSIRSKIKSTYDAIISFCEGRTLKFHSYIADHTNKNISWVHCDLNKIHYTRGAAFKPQHEVSSYEKMDHLVFVSQAAKNGFKREFRDTSLVESGMWVCNNPIDIDYVRSYKADDKNDTSIFKIVCVGRLVKEKAFHRVIKLATKLAENGIRFHVKILGEGDLRHDLESKISETGLSESVELCGFVNPPYRIMSEADIFLCTSLTEGMPLVHLESMALGIPVLTTRCNATEELYKGFEQYALVEQNDEDIFNGVMRMINEPELRMKNREIGYNIVSRFSPENILAFFDELI